MNLDELFSYKTKMMKAFCTDERIVGLLTDREPVILPNKALSYSQIFPYEYIPDTVDHANTFICFDVDIGQVYDKTFLTPSLYVWIFTHKSKLRLDKGGVRTDTLAIEINRILNGNRYFGLGELNLSQVGRFSPISDYQGRSLSYQAREFNRPAHIRRRQEKGL